jgi:hypothetical protein
MVVPATVVEGKPERAITRIGLQTRRRLHVPVVFAWSDLFPLEFWLHLWGNAKGALRQFEHRKTDVSML